MSLQEISGDRGTSLDVPQWWPDWDGESVAIVASGPSLKTENVNLLRGRMKVIAVKQSFDRCPFADVVYGCDGPWWKHRRGLPEFNGLKIAWDAKACAQFDSLRKIEIRENGRKNPIKYADELIMAPIGTIGSGGNSGFQALNLALQFGARRILLLGFDMHDRGGVHWYGRNNWPRGNNPDETNFSRWRRAFQVAAGQLAGLGAQVINANPLSALKCFPYRSIEQALHEWDL